MRWDGEKRRAKNNLAWKKAEAEEERNQVSKGQHRRRVQLCCWTDFDAALWKRTLNVAWKDSMCDRGSDITRRSRQIGAASGMASNDSAVVQSLE